MERRTILNAHSGWRNLNWQKESYIFYMNNNVFLSVYFQETVNRWETFWCWNKHRRYDKNLKNRERYIPVGQIDFCSVHIVLGQRKNRCCIRIWKAWLCWIWSIFPGEPNAINANAKKFERLILSKVTAKAKRACDFPAVNWRPINILLFELLIWAEDPGPKIDVCKKQSTSVQSRTVHQ